MNATAKPRSMSARLRGLMATLLQIHEPGQTPLPHAKRAIAVGIDLGTTNSLVAVSENNKPLVLEDVNGRALVPSAVLYQAGQIVVGGVPGLPPCPR